METFVEKSDFEPKKLARQVDNTDLNGSPSAVALTLTPKRIKIGRRPRSEFPVLPSPLYPPPLPPVSTAKPEFQSSQSHHNAEFRHSTTKEQKRCKCQRSRCLKLYCECFASGNYCDGCNCADCKNTEEKEVQRKAAIASYLERLPNAPKPKITGSEHRADETKDNKNWDANARDRSASRGIASASMLTSSALKSVNAWTARTLKNANPPTCGTQQTNVTLTAPVVFSGCRSSLENRNDQENLLSPNRMDQLICRLAPSEQVHESRSFGPFSVLPVIPVCHSLSPPALGSSNSAYRRSLLAGTIQPKDMRELCSILVVVSDAAQVHADNNGSINVPTRKENQRLSYPAVQDSMNRQAVPEDQKAVPHGESAKQVDMIGKDDRRPHIAGKNSVRPMSPRTLAFMCDEKDALISPAASSDQIKYYGYKTDVYAEQERLVLKNLLGCLNRLITRANLKEKEYSLSGRAQTLEQWGSVATR